VHFPELAPGSGGQRSFMGGERTGIGGRGSALEDYADVSGLSEKTGEEVGGPGAGEGFEIREDENGNRCSR
jgi:hypothetical protein